MVGEMPNLIMVVQVILNLIKTGKTPADLHLYQWQSSTPFSSEKMIKHGCLQGIRDYLKSFRESESLSEFCIVAMKL